MTVSTQTPVISYTANGVTTVFAYNFRILAAADLKVTVDGTVKTLNVDYTVSGVNDDGGGNVTFTTAPASANQVVLKRNMELRRGTDYQDNGDLLADTLNGDQDAPVMMLQQLRADINRAVKLPEAVSTDQVLATGGTTSERADKVMGFGPDGAPKLFESPDNAALSASLASTASGKGAALVGYPTEGGTVKDALDARLPEIGTYALLRAYSGDLTAYYVRGRSNILDYGHGVFRVDAADTTSSDNDWSILVDALGRRWKLEGRQDIDVRRFGVALDGATVNTAALAACFAAAAEKTVHFYEGTCLTDTQVVGVKCKIVVHAGAVVKAIASAAAGGLITLSVAGSVLAGDGIIDGNRAAQVNQCDGVRLTADKCKVRDLNIKDAYRYGLRGVGVSDSKIRDLRVETCGDVGIGIIYSGTTPVHRNSIKGCHVESVGDLTTQGGIKIIGDPGTSLPSANNSIIGCTVLTPTQICIEAYGNCKSTVIKGNTTRGGTMGVSADRSHSSTISGNTIWAPTLYGIELASSQRCTVSGNTVDGANTTTRGIITTNTNPTHNTIDGNTIYDIAGKDILISPNSDGTVVSANVCTKGSNSGYGIDCASSRVTITGNTIDGNNVSTVNIFTDSASQIVLSNNICRRATQAAIENYANNTAVDNIFITGGILLDAASRWKLTTAGTGSFGSNMQSRAVGGLGGKDYNDRAANVWDGIGTGTPEGVQTAGIGSTWRRTNGGAGTTLYVKESGTGNTGWAAK